MDYGMVIRFYLRIGWFTDLKSCHVGHFWEMEVHVSSILEFPANWTLVDARRSLEPAAGPDLQLLRKL